MGEDRGEQRADIPGVDLLLARLLEVDAEPEVVLDLNEQVGQPDGAATGVQPAVQLGEALRLRRVGRLGRVRLQPPPCVVERDLPVVSDTLQEAVERIRQAGLQVRDRRVGVDGESGARPERLADPLPLGGGQEEGLEAAEVLRALDGEVAGLELVAHLEEQRALPAAAVRHAVAADERLQRRWSEVQRHIGRQAAAPRRAVFAVGPQRRQRRRGALALLVDELHPAQKRRGELAQPGVPLGRLLEAGLPVAPRPVRQVGLVLAQLLLRHDGQQSGSQPVVADVGIEQHGAKPPVALNDPVDGVALRLEHVVEAVFDQLPIPVEELAVHVDGLVERVAPRLVQEAHQREVAARGGHLAHPVGRCGPDAVEQDTRGRMQVIALLSTKGGAGKTALATAMAVEMGAVVLDLDPQASACRWRDRREAAFPVVTDVAPARLRPTLNAARARRVATVVLDTPPRSETAALEAARAADLVIVPCRPQIVDLETVPTTIQVLALARDPLAVAVLVAVPPRGQRADPAGGRATAPTATSAGSPTPRTTTSSTSPPRCSGSGST